MLIPLRPPRRRRLLAWSCPCHWAGWLVVVNPGRNSPMVSSRGSTAEFLPRYLRQIVVVLCALTIFSPGVLAQQPAPASPATYPIRAFLPYVSGPPPSRVVLAAAHIDSRISGEPDEAILLWNVGSGAQPLAGWQLVTRSRRATFPITTTLTLAPGQRIWCTAQAATFRHTFGEDPACQWDDEGEDDPAVLKLAGSLTLANQGGFIQLVDDRGQLVDTLVYGDIQTPTPGWNGPAAQLYTRGSLAAAGQIWQRKLHPQSGLPVDTDQAGDWAGDLRDPFWGRRVRFPGWMGWDLDGFLRPSQGRATATVTVAVGPEGLYQPLADALAQAATSVDLSLYTLEHPELTRILADAARRGVQVRLLLDGTPPGGITDLQRWCVAELAAAGVHVRYLAPDDSAPRGYATRYRYLHAKYGLIDGRLALVGTENWSLDAMPLPSAEAGAGPAGGRRGFYLLTDAAPVVQALQGIFDWDWAPERFLDLTPFQADHPRYGAPPADFVLPPPPEYPVAAAPFSAPQIFMGTAIFMVVSAPENAMRPDDGLFGLLQEAGPGDTILLEQLYEHKHWGSSQSNPIADPNPRLQLVVDAARRGARVRILLDSYFDEAEDLRSNHATARYLTELAQAEGLDLEVRLGNPTGGGIHAKLVLLDVGGNRWSAIGSLNGSEVSHKVNREVMVLSDLPELHGYLAQVFAWDWAHSPPWSPGS
uniref:phospholipase D n=1 Tax=Litorilinea aerophila TaxID=1204385 RepID=A0A540VDE1_9CHLR